MAIKLSATRLDLGTARLDNANLRAYSEVTNALGNVSGATTINLALGCIVTATATAAVTWTITNTPSSSAYCAFTLILTNGGRYTQVWPSGTKWQNSVSPTLSVIGTDVLTFFTVDGGTTWQGSVVMQNSTSTGRLFAWGYGALGRLGLGDAANRSSPVQVSGSWAAVTVNSTTSSHSAVIKSDGSLWVWGRNSYGQLGQSDVVHRSSPVQVAGTWIQVVTGQNHTAAIKTDNTLWTWGYNHRGQLGIGSTQSGAGSGRSVPQQVAGTWSAIGAGLWSTFAINTSSELFAWGSNANGALGLGDTAHRSSPVQIGGTWSSLSAGYASCTAFRSAGTLWVWGKNDAGALGLSDAVDRSSPVQLQGTWSLVHAATYHVLGINSSNKLFVWGEGSLGRLGLGDTVTRSSPVQVGTGSWTAVAGGVSHSLGIQPSGQLFAWGRNHVGQLGLEDTANRSSPVQVAGTWASISAALYHSKGLKS